MKQIYEGIRTFQRDIYPQQRELYQKLRAGQSPDALFITCADSRVVPNQITQSPPGRLFIARNAGNLVPAADRATSSECASLEYAVKVLGVRDIIVCGHTDCGAVKFLTSGKAGQGELPHVDNWVTHAEGVRQRCEMKAHAHPELSAIELAIQQNVLLQVDNVRSHSFVAEREAAGKLTLHAWVFRLEDGDIVTYDATREKFVSIGGAACNR